MLFIPYPVDWGGARRVEPEANRIVKKITNIFDYAAALAAAVLSGNDG